MNDQIKFDRLGRRMKHGMTKTPKHQAWQDMQQRCYNQKIERYVRYGGRGIKVCDRWLGRNGFVNFLSDMGHRPSPNHSIDRKNNDGDYCPENCRWATRAEQNRNRSDNILIEFDGKTQTVAEWAREKGMNVRTLRLRIDKGMPPAIALTLPVAKRTWAKSPPREAKPIVPGAYVDRRK